MNTNSDLSKPRFDRRELLASGCFLAGLVTIALWPSSGLGQDATPGAEGVDGARYIVNDAELYAVEHGDPNGPPVLFLHGGLGNTENWALVWPRFAEAGYRVILLDSRSQGRSGWSDQPITFELMASDVIGLLDQLEIEQTDVVGWSDGAVVSLELAINDPDRLRRVVAFGANISPDGLELPESGQGLEALLAQMASDYQRLSPQPERFEELFAQLGALYAIAPNFAEDDLRGISTPFLILDGANEELVRPDQPVQLATLIPDAQLVLMPGTGHFAPLEKPEEFAQIALAFLAGETVGTPLP